MEALGLLRERLADQHGAPQVELPVAEPGAAHPLGPHGGRDAALVRAVVKRNCTGSPVDPPVPLE